MALFGGIYLPCLIGLLPDKQSDTYVRFFAMVWAYNDNNNLPNNFANQYFMTDFEVAIRDGFRLFWPDINLLGCYFHFSQLIWKRVKQNGFQTTYETDEDFHAFVRRLASLPFVKSGDLDKGFDIFSKRANDLKNEKVKEFCLDLIEYAKVQWRERFIVQDWNLYDLNCLLVPATNNGNESANGRFSMDFGAKPQFWNFCLTMAEELEYWKV